MKQTIQILAILGLAPVLSGCLTQLATVAASQVLASKMITKTHESKPPKTIEIEQQGRIITASFEAKGFIVGMDKAAQLRGFQSWATAAVVREASKRGCVNIVNAFSANAGIKTKTTISSTSMSNSVRFKCLEKETIGSEQDLLSDKQVIYQEQIQYINENPEMVVYK